MSDPVRCYKHYCRVCHAEHYIDSKSKEYPRCCGRPMAFLGVVTHVPGRSEENMVTGDGAAVGGSDEKG